MKFDFEITTRSYAIAIEDDPFLDLLDSESYVTENAAFKEGQETLSSKLDALPGVSKTDYNGHFRAYVYLTIDDDEDKPALKTKIARIIEKHLAWCAKLPKAQHVIDRRAERKRTRAQDA